MARRAILCAGKSTRVIGVSRFADLSVRTKLEEAGIDTIQCDLLDQQAVGNLPFTKNVIYLAGKKFGTTGDQPGTWAANVSAPNHAAQQFRQSRIVIFSTGCVYPLTAVSSGGSQENNPPAPVGEYAMSCLGRERVFEYWSSQFNTPICLFRLNYAVDLRYGVIHDIAQDVYQDRLVDISVNHFNVIWQGDACARALLCLEQCALPATVLNISGGKILSTRRVAEQFGVYFGKRPRFTGDFEMSKMYLSNASRAATLFGPPLVPEEKLIRWQAHWIAMGGRSLAKPTHFEVTDGNF